MLKNDLCTLRTKIDFEFDGKRVKDEVQKNQPLQDLNNLRIKS